MSTAGLPGERLAHRTHPIAGTTDAEAGAATKATQPSDAVIMVNRARILRSLTVSSSQRISALQETRNPARSPPRQAEWRTSVSTAAVARSYRPRHRGYLEQQSIRGKPGSTRTRG